MWVVRFIKKQHFEQKQKSLRPDWIQNDDQNAWSRSSPSTPQKPDISVNGGERVTLKVPVKSKLNLFTLLAHITSLVVNN